MKPAAFSLPELLITIAVIGILAAIAIPRLGGLVPAAKVGVNGDAMSFLNRGVLLYSQTEQAIPVAATSGTSDEFAVLALLKANDPDIPASRYIPTEFVATSSSETTDNRLQWTGKFFKLLPPGTAGNGIVVAQ